MQGQLTGIWAAAAVTQFSTDSFGQFSVEKGVGQVSIACLAKVMCFAAVFCKAGCFWKTLAVPLQFYWL